jgi:hypothetical protein
VTLQDESERATEMLSGKVVKRVERHRDTELLIEFACGTRLFVDGQSSIELSITRQSAS